MDDLDNAIAETKAVLQPLFSKPKLSTKLLSKPPFRFIHDIVTATCDSTGFPDGLFEPHELQSSTYKDDKTAKLGFLDKLISLVNVGCGKSMDVSSSKIVAGLEPLNTNFLLAAFGRLAVDKELDRNALIKLCRGGPSNLAAAVTDASENANTEESSPEDSVVAVPETCGATVSSLKQLVETKCNEDLDKTIQMISSVTTKPKCSEKLLNKPPFRYLHDLVIAIASAADYDLEQVFSEYELNSANIKEKQDKLEFLGKLIRFLSDKTGVPIDVKPSKIVAGLEAERTRYLLQVYTVVATAKDSHHIISAGNFDDELRATQEAADNEKEVLERVEVELTDKPTPKSVSDSPVRTSSPDPIKTDDSSPTVPTHKDTGIANDVVAPTSPSVKKDSDPEPLIEHEDGDEELPDFDDWIESADEAKHLNVSTSVASDVQLRLHRAIDNCPATSLMLPSKLSTEDLESISLAVEDITELTKSLGELMGMIGTDMQAMTKERIHLTEQIQQS